jgi:hypothetical protein
MHLHVLAPGTGLIVATKGEAKLLAAQTIKAGPSTNGGVLPIRSNKPVEFDHPAVD